MRASASPGPCFPFHILFAGVHFTFSVSHGFLDGQHSVNLESDLELSHYPNANVLLSNGLLYFRAPKTQNLMHYHKEIPVCSSLWQLAHFLLDPCVGQLPASVTHTRGKYVKAEITQLSCDARGLGSL